MRRYIPLLLIFLMLGLPSWVSAAEGDEPLTLMQPTQQSAQPGLSQTLPYQIDELRDIQGPVTFSAPLPYLPMLIGGLLLLLLLAVLFWFLKKREKPGPPPIPPWEKALLDLADARKLLSVERGLLYMNQASQILRSYIESRFSIQSTRQTTREFLGGLKEVGTDSPLQLYKNELQGCLEQADMAKFAHHIPNIENLESMEDAVSNFVKRTEPTAVGPGEKS